MIYWTWEQTATQTLIKDKNVVGKQERLKSNEEVNTGCCKIRNHVTLHKTIGKPVPCNNLENGKMHTCM